MFPSGPQTRSRFRCLVIITLMAAGVLVLPSGSFANPDDPKPQKIQVFAVLKEDKEVAQVSNEVVTITRGPGGCPPVTIVKKGVPLCKDDTVKIGHNIRLRILFEDEKGKSEITLEQDSEFKVGSIWCNRICRWFASLSGRFDNRVQHVSLINDSTMYEANWLNDQSVVVTVFEGELKIKKIQDSDSSPGDASAETPTTGNNVPESVPRLFKAFISPDGTIVKKPMNLQALCRALEFSTGAELLLHQTPAEVGGNVAKLPNFDNDGQRNDMFADERCNSFWEPSQGQHFETLGYIYTDWNDGEKALEMFAKAIDRYQTEPNWTGPSDKLRINKALALHQLGTENDAKALEELASVLAKADSPFLGSALNAKGSILYDEARNELLYNRTDDGLAKAKDLMSQARDSFAKALPPAGMSPTQIQLYQQYIDVNRAQIFRTEADIAQREGNYSLAEKNYLDAIKKLMEAYGHKGDNPTNKIASVLVARAWAALANTYVAMGKPDQSQDSYGKAEVIYKGVIEDANKSEQTFAAPFCGLGSLYLILGDKKKADENYDQCVGLSTTALVKDVAVPNVLRLSRAAAIQVLSEAGLRPEIGAGAETGEIVETQEPAQGVVKAGTTIKINLSSRDRY